MSYKKFNLIFILIFFPLMAIIALINLIIDPYGIIGSPAISGFNLYKPKQKLHERAYKVYEIKRCKFDTVFLGSSRVLYGIDPEYYQTLTGRKTYNFAISGPNLKEIEEYVKYVIKTQPDLKQIIIGLDFYAFNKNWKLKDDYNADRLKTDFYFLKDFIDFSISADTLLSSFETIKANLTEKKKFKSFSLTGCRTDESLSHDEAKNIPLEDLKLQTKIDLYYAYQPIPAKEIKNVIDICKNKNINLILFINPVHAAELEKIKEAGLWIQYKKWIQELAEIYPVWDFSGYNHLTTGPILSRTGGNFWDCSHYKKDIGNFIIDKIANLKGKTASSDFGIYITKDNIRQYLNKLQQDQKNWEDKNKVLIEIIKEKWQRTKMPDL